jgi:hypothetical protein
LHGGVYNLCKFIVSSWKEEMNPLKYQSFQQYKYLLF